MVGRSCEICGERAVARCRICGRYVCERHYVAEEGVCVVCHKALCSICRKRLSVARCMICGRPVCDSCSVQVDNVRRICVECLRKYFNGNVRLVRLALRERRLYKVPEAPRRVTLKVMSGTYR